MNFIEYIYEQKNTHMTHIEDKVLYGGVNGTREAILALRSLRDMLGGVKDGNVSGTELQLFFAVSILVMVNFLLLRKGYSTNLQKYTRLTLTLMLILAVILV